MTRAVRSKQSPVLRYENRTRRRMARQAGRRGGGFKRAPGLSRMPRATALLLREAVTEVLKWGCWKSGVSVP